MFHRRSSLLSSCFIAASLLLFSVASSQENERQLLNRLGGVYGGNYLITNTFLDEDGEEIDSGVVSTGGRIVLPRRNGQRLRGSISLGLGIANFDQRVRKIRVRKNRAIYRGPFVLSVQDSDQPPFIGKFRANAKIKRTKERLIFRFNTLVELESTGPDSPAINQLNARFKSIR